MCGAKWIAKGSGRRALSLRTPYILDRRGYLHRFDPGFTEPSVAGAQLPLPGTVLGAKVGGVIDLEALGVLAAPRAEHEVIRAVLAGRCVSPQQPRFM